MRFSGRNSAIPVCDRLFWMIVKRTLSFLPNYVGTWFRRYIADTSSTSVMTTHFYRRPLPRHCIALSSPEGRRIFRETLLLGYMQPYFGLAGQLCTQEEPSYCGLATLVMILNAFEMDPGRVWKGLWRWYHETLLTGLPEDVLTQGIALDKFAEIARCHGLHVELHYVNSKEGLSDFRDLVAKMTSNDELGYLVCCYHRGAMEQTGSGHFAAVGGYNPHLELIFLFDTARFKYPSHWAPLIRLWEGMGQVDPVTQKPRGYMIITRAATNEKITDAIQSSVAKQDMQKQNLEKDPPLFLFGISNSTRQAYLSPDVLRDTNSVGFRLRQVISDWTNWLNSKFTGGDADPSLVAEALSFILTTYDHRRPGNFFITVQQFVGVPPHACKSETQAVQHQILRDLLSSSVGKIVTKAVRDLPSDMFDRLAAGDIFHSNVVRSNSSQSVTESSAPCPFTEITDPRLCLSLLLTCFLYCFPYSDVANQGTLSSGSTRSEHMLHLVQTAQLQPSTVRELQTLRSVFHSLMTIAVPPVTAEGSTHNP